MTCTPRHNSAKPTRTFLNNQASVKGKIMLCWRNLEGLAKDKFILQWVMNVKNSRSHFTAQPQISNHGKHVWTSKCSLILGGLCTCMGTFRQLMVPIEDGRSNKYWRPLCWRKRTLRFIIVYFKCVWFPISNVKVTYTNPAKKKEKCTLNHVGRIHRYILGLG